MTKAEIVQRLLDERQITAEEAVVLLANQGRINYYPYNPTHPYPTWEVTSTPPFEYSDTKWPSENHD